jgi:membrane protein YqaA with SNARE-associated domain
MNFYLNVFIESIGVSSFVPFISDPTFFAMKGFGGYDMQLAVVLAVAGSAIGAALCYIVGQWLSKIFLKSGKNNVSMEKYNRASRFFSRNIMVLMLLTWLPLLKFLPLISGLLDGSFRITMLLVVLGKIGYYGYHGLM